MLEIGLTGNIGSGKTTVCKIFESLGIPVYYSDLEAKRLYLLDDVKNSIFIKLSSKVFNTEGEIDFKLLAKEIFSNKKSLEYINRLIHPLVFEHYQQWKSLHNNTPYVIHESAILFEHHLESKFNKTIVVYAPKNIRVQRVIERDHATEADVRIRISNQMDDVAKNKLADYIIFNDEEQMLVPQVMALHKKLKKQAK